MIPVLADSEDETNRHRGEWLLLLLALPVSFLCVGLMTYLTHWIWPNQTVQANMLVQGKADYGGRFSQSTRFAYVDRVIIINVTADAAGLRVTPGAHADEPARDDGPVFIVPGPVGTHCAYVDEYGPANRLTAAAHGHSHKHGATSRHSHVHTGTQPHAGAHANSDTGADSNTGGSAAHGHHKNHVY